MCEECGGVQRGGFFLALWFSNIFLVVTGLQKRPETNVMFCERSHKEKVCQQHCWCLCIFPLV